MGHLVEAFKKLDQKRAAERPKPARRSDAAQRAAIRPKPVRRTPAAVHAAKVWRIDDPHRIAAAHRPAGPLPADTADAAVNARQSDEVRSAAETPEAQALAKPSPPEVQLPTGGGGRSAAEVGWRFSAPAVPDAYYHLAASLVAQARGTARPHTVLLTAVSSPGLDTVSLAALSALLSAQGNILWVDTRNVRPTSNAVGPPHVKVPGWHELLARQATWEEIIAPTNLPGVSFVGCGDRSLETPGSELRDNLFEPLRSAFSFVLIDGGLVEESVAMASECGVTGLVVPLGHARRSQVDRALRMLGLSHSIPLVIAVEPYRAG
jgi:hypothetical protein